MICKFEAQYRAEKRKIFGDSEFPELDYKGRNTAEMDFSRTIAEFSLRTGFTDKTIKKMLSQMEELNYIVIDENIIRRPESG